MKKYLPKPPELLIPAILATIFMYQSQDTSLPAIINLPIWVIFFITQVGFYVVVRTIIKIVMEDNQPTSIAYGLGVLVAINLAMTTGAFFGILHVHPQAPLPLIQWIGYPSLSLFIALSEVLAVAMIGFMTFLGFWQFANDL